MIYCYDLDGTICETVDGDYARSRPFPQIVENVNQLYADGHKVMIWTARGSETKIDWRALTEWQLNEWGLHYHELHFGKPYADFYVDDKAVRARPMEVSAIVQARMESTRLPGKVMMDIGGKPILAHVVESAKMAVGNVIIATTPASAEIIAWAKENAIPYVLDRHPRDVLDTFYNCALKYGIEHIVRLTADNPLVDPKMIKKLITFYEDGGYDWAGNCRLKVTYPVGNDAEVFSFRALGKAWLWTVAEDYQHVTPYIYNHPQLFKLGVMENDKDESDQRWTVDTLEDLERVREIYKERCDKCLTRG